MVTPWGILRLEGTLASSLPASISQIAVEWWLLQTAIGDSHRLSRMRATEDGLFVKIAYLFRL